MITNPKVPELLNETLLRLRDVTSLLVLNGQSVEAQQALSLVQGVEMLANQSTIAVGLTAIEMGFVRAGDRIRAIKAHRDRTKMSLKGSKDIVEAAAAKAGILF